MNKWRQIQKTFNAEFKLQTTLLDLDKNHTIVEAVEAMNVDKSTINKWVRKIKLEQQEQSPKASPIASE